MAQNYRYLTVEFSASPSACEERNDLFEFSLHVCPEPVLVYYPVFTSIFWHKKFGTKRTFSHLPGSVLRVRLVAHP